MEPEIEARYQALGFSRAGVSLKLRIGNVDLVAVDHPWRGTVVIYTSVTPREMTQYEADISAESSTELIAAAIYKNFAASFRKDAEECKRQFESRGFPPYRP